MSPGQFETPVNSFQREKLQRGAVRGAQGPRGARAVATSVSDDGGVIVGMSAGRQLSGRGSVGWDADTSDTRALRWTADMQDLTQLLASGGVDMTGIT